MAAPIQVTIADQHGIDVRQLIRAIEVAYTTANGKPARVKVGQGVAIDGVPDGMLRIVDRT